VTASTARSRLARAVATSSEGGELSSSMRWSDRRSAWCAFSFAAARVTTSSATMFEVPSQSTPMCASRTRRAFTHSSM
jgi:hypothetical protein